MMPSFQFHEGVPSGFKLKQGREKHPSISNRFRQGDVEHEEYVGSLE